MFIFDLNNKYYNYYYNDYKKIITFFIILIASFIFYLFITLFIGRHWNNNIKKDDNNSNLKKISNEIMNGIEAAIYFNGIYSFIITLLYCHIDNEKYYYLFDDNYYIYITVLMNKFYYFTFIYYCLSVSEDKKGFEFISGATLISLYLLIWNFFISISLNYAYIPFLISTQIVISGLITLLALIFILTYFYIIYYVIKVFKEFEINMNCLFICFHFCFLRFFMYYEDTHDCCGFYLNKNGDCFWKCCFTVCNCCKNIIDVPDNEDNVINQQESQDQEILERNSKEKKDSFMNEDNEEDIELYYESEDKLKYFLIKNVFNVQD